MLVFWREKLVIFAVPKTGTSALEGALAPHADIMFRNPPVMKHIPVYRFNRFLKPLFDVVGANNLETVACIREPLSWLGSWYKYRSRPDLDGTANSTKDVSFDDFVLGYLKGSRPPYSEVGSQERFLMNKQGEQAVTHLFQYEQQDKYLAFLKERLGVDLSLRQSNISPPRDFGLSAEIEVRLRRKRAAEFSLWKQAEKP